jgi:hypothetical protein
MDDTQDVVAALRALANNGAKANKTARLRRILPEINTLQESGVSHEQILATLNDCGFDLKMGAYSTLLWRVRHGKVKNQPIEVTAAPPKVSATDSVVSAIPGGDFGTPLAGEIQQGPGSDLTESRKKREDKARRYIGADSNPLLKHLQGK